MKLIMSWLLSDDCPVVYDDWSDEYVWSCMMRIDGRYSAQKVPDEVGNAITRHHNFHHNNHPAQTQDWCIGVRTLSDVDVLIHGIDVETVCSHEVEDDDNLSNDWTAI
jgi:hypothetical protein